jgi:hypothetical protein
MASGHHDEARVNREQLLGRTAYQVMERQLRSGQIQVAGEVTDAAEMSLFSDGCVRIHRLCQTIHSISNHELEP